MPKRGENIRKRKDGRWEARLIHFYDTNGKAQYKSIYAHSYNEVKQKAKLFDVSQKNQDINCKKYMSEICVNWLDNVKCKVKQSTFSQYNSIVNKHIMKYFKNVQISTVTRQITEIFINSLSNLSAKTIHDIVLVLVQIIKFAERNGDISSFNYDLNLPKLPPKELKVLTKSEQERLKNHIKADLTPKNFGILLTMYTGLRLGELCGLKWDDIDISAGIIKVKRTVQRIKNTDENAETNTKIIIDTPKSQKSIRQIPIHFSLISIIKKLQLEPDSYILSGTNDFVEPRVYENYFKKVLNLAKIDDINFHSLRHLFATNAVECDFEIKSLSEILGHSTVKFTLDKYVHSSVELKRENINKLASCF